MLISINKTRQLELVGEELENSENEEYYFLVKVQPVALEHRGDQVIQKVAVDNHLALHIPKEDGQLIESAMLKRYYQNA